MKWADIKGFNGTYQVSDGGDVGTTNKGGLILKAWIDKGGYKNVRLSYGNGQRKTYRVNRLVAEYFVPNPEGKPAVNHKDCNKLNNKADNLEWMTWQENIDHAFENGLCSRRKINHITRRKVRDMLEQGARTSEVARIFNLSASYVSIIKHGTLKLYFG